MAESYYESIDAQWAWFTGKRVVNKIITPATEAKARVARAALLTGKWIGDRARQIQNLACFLVFLQQRFIFTPDLIDVLGRGYVWCKERHRPLRSVFLLRYPECTVSDLCLGVCSGLTAL